MRAPAHFGGRGTLSLVIPQIRRGRPGAGQWDTRLAQRTRGPSSRQIQHAISYSSPLAVRVSITSEVSDPATIDMQIQLLHCERRQEKSCGTSRLFITTYGITTLHRRLFSRQSLAMENESTSFCRQQKRGSCSFSIDRQESPYFRLKREVFPGVASQQSDLPRRSRSIRCFPRLAPRSFHWTAYGGQRPLM